ncbi:MAG: hypothetical protein JWM81_512 [Candidatus Saccharibacteria bacterium]|nr:hypothetical protein [Candidatus Saccharibacteria bacterium]
MAQKIITFLKRPAVLLIAGILIGVLAVLIIRFATYSPNNEHTHYHANFAVFINGQREEFKAARYYQEVSICATGKGITIPQQRAHMHDNINSAIHVHDHAVTWGQFFENLGWYIGPDFIEKDDGTMYREDATNKLHLIIDGQDYTGITTLTNTVIKDQSRVLISFGNIDATTLTTEFKAVPSTAKHLDETPDPASCSGSEETVTTTDRLKHLF